MRSWWFRREAQRTFTETYATFDAALSDETARIKALRRQLLSLYEEIDLALRALDLLGTVSDQARERVRVRLAHGAGTTPEVFTKEWRQRHHGDMVEAQQHEGD